MRRRCSVMLAVAGYKAGMKHMMNTTAYRPLAVCSAASGPLWATIGPVTTKVSMVPMVPQVSTKFTSFGEATLVCREPRVMIDV